MPRLIQSEEEATQVAEQMCRELGKGWEPRVWENMGWCCSADLKTDGVSYTVNKVAYDHLYGYKCYATTADGPGHLACFGDVPCGDTAEEAFANCICQIGNYIDKIEKLYDFGTEQFIAEKFKDQD